MTIAKNPSLDQPSGKYFSLALSRSLIEEDIERSEEIRAWTNRSCPDGVPSAKIIDQDMALAARSTWESTPAKHRSTPSLELPIVYFDLEADWIWHPELSGKPFELDFLDGPLGYRIARADSDSSPLRKALPKARDTTNKHVWDLCGGWRVDALLMAHWGYEVLSFEKSPWVHLLSSRALHRSQIVAQKELLLEVKCQDATEALESIPLTGATPPSIIYIDPMYPKTGATALNQSDMRFLHYLSSSDDIAEFLLEKSLPIALDRVVIKRPVKAEEFARKPDFKIEQGSTRYDIYLTKNSEYHVG